MIGSVGVILANAGKGTTGAASDLLAMVVLVIMVVLVGIALVWVAARFVGWLADRLIEAVDFMTRHE